MPEAYAGLLHIVKRPNVCIVRKSASADYGGMGSTRHKVEVGRRLRIAIEAVAPSLAEVCRELDISPSKLGNWLRGDNYPEMPWIIRFCDRYGVTTDWIFRGVVSGASSDVAAALWKAGQGSGVELRGEDPPAFEVPPQRSEKVRKK